MIIHPSLSVLIVAGNDDVSLLPFVSYLQSIEHVHLSIKPQLPHDLSHYDAVVTGDTTAFLHNCDPLSGFVHAGGGWLGLVHL